MDYIDHAVTELKRSEFPIYIYGAGELARRIDALLKQSDVDVKGFLVDKAYYTNGMTFCGKAVEILENGPEIESNVILGFITVSPEKEEYLRNHKKVHKLYTVDFGGALAFQDGRNTFDDAFIKEHREMLVWLYEQMTDFASKSALVQFIAQKYTGMYRKECSRQPQYFDSDIINVGSDEVFVDCGAYNGDTALAFIDFLKSKGISDFKHIFAFEADSKNYAALCRATSDVPNVTAYDLGVWDKSETLYFNESSSTSSRITSEGCPVKVTSIDELISDKPVTFIKMDIEGAELKALTGAKNTIQRYKPKLAICVYHKKDDLLTIPQLIKQYNSDYKLYFRNYSVVGVESVLYAI